MESGLTMNKRDEVKRKHHYVWRQYLESWAVDNEVCYISKKGVVSSDSSRGLARDTDFYKIKILSQDDVNYLSQWFKKSPDYLQRIHSSFIDDLFESSLAITMLEHSVFSPEEVQKEKTIFLHNTLENLHSVIERSVGDVLKELCQGNADVLYETNNQISFTAYLGHQFTRTKSFRIKSLSAIYKNSAALNLELFELTKRNWWLLSFIFGINVGASFNARRELDEYILLVNETALSFITSEEPVINIHPSVEKLSEMETPSSMDLYFPLTPKYAFLIKESNGFKIKEKKLSIDEVHDLNTKMANKKSGKIFGSSKEDISLYRRTN